MDELMDRGTGPEREWMDLAEEAGQLREAMSSRAPIEQAKGILMTLRGFDSETAWAELQRASSEENVKLRDLASALVSFTGGRSARPGQQSPTSLTAAAVVKRRWGPAVRASRARTTRPAAPAVVPTSAGATETWRGGGRRRRVTGQPGDGGVPDAPGPPPPRAYRETGRRNCLSVPAATGLPGQLCSCALRARLARLHEVAAGVTGTLVALGEVS